MLPWVPCNQWVISGLYPNIYTPVGLKSSCKPLMVLFVVGENSPPVWGWWSKWVIVPPLIRMPCNQGSLDFVLVTVTLLGMKIYKIGDLQTCSHCVKGKQATWDENDRDLNNWNIYDDIWIMYIYIYNCIFSIHSSIYDVSYSIYYYSLYMFRTFGFWFKSFLCHRFFHCDQWRTPQNWINMSPKHADIPMGF